MAELVIVGGGIVGLATASALLRRHPGLELLVLEKEDRVGVHQSGHNSGVIHTGVYYAPGSLKARLCVEGRAALLRFCDAHSIPYELCGKVIVATRADELPRLHTLHRRSVDNLVAGVELIDQRRLREIEPHVTGLEALHVPGAGIVDFQAVLRALAADVERDGGRVLTGHRLGRVRREPAGLRLETSGGPVRAKALIACAGLQSDRVAMRTGAPADPRIVPFRGSYHLLRPERRQLVRNLVYPVPDPALPFLGVHFTRRLPDGEVLLGPNAILAGARERYGRRSLSLRDLGASVAWPGLWRLARRHWRTGLAELVRDVSRRAMVRELQRYVPELRAEDVAPGPSGIRAQALARDGSLVDDFVVSSGDRIVHVRNAPSPAATSALAIAELIADTAASTFGWASGRR